MGKAKLDPEPNYKLLAVFPTEIWNLVLMSLTDYEDYVQISSSSSMFKSLLQSLRTTILFRNVFENLFNYTHRQGNQPTGKKPLSLRRVCSSWRNGVDSVLHNLRSPYLSEFCPTFASMNDFQNFWRYFRGENNSINPFPHRSVNLYPPFSLLELPSYNSELLDMLCKFGHKVWYCNMDMFFDSPEARTNFYQQLVDIMQQLPNLRQLRFRDNTDLTRYPVELLDESLPLQEFPTMKYLEHLDSYGMPTTVTRQLLESNLQIYDVYGEHWQVYLGTLLSLEELYLDISNMNDWEKFQNARVISPLKYLKLNLSESVLPWNNLLTTINSHFGKTLKNLFISARNHSNFPKMLTSTDVDNSKVDTLRNLQVVTLHTKHAVSLDFLLPIRHNLEKLHIVISENNSNHFINQSETVVKFHQFGNQIHHSNIWQQFAKLQCISVERQPNPKNVYNRQY